jgi:hypothetical protein
VRRQDEDRSLWSSDRRFDTISGMDELAGLQRDRHWRMAIWSLRVGYIALVTAVVGLIVYWAGFTPWVLGVGVIAWLVTVVVTLTGFLWARRRLPEPRVRLWSMRMRLIHDSVHSLSSTQLF